MVWKDTYTGRPDLRREGNKEFKRSRGKTKCGGGGAGRSLLQRLDHRRLRGHHGSGDLQRGVALVPHAVHVLEGIPSQRVDEDPGGVGVGHVLHLEGAGAPAATLKWPLSGRRANA